MHEEQWTRVYRYKVSNGIHIDMNLKLHLPSHLTIAGHRVLVTYDGSPLRAMDVMTRGTCIQTSRGGNVLRPTTPSHHPPHGRM
jgi:hypothetical protein